MKRGVAKLLLLGFFLVLSDLLLGQAAKLLVPVQDHIQLLEQERSYRVDSDLYHHGLVANVATTGGWGPRQHPIHTNSLGFKDASVREVPLHTTGPRVVVIGDSFTEGIGVAYPDTFVGRIDAQLRPAGIDVLNAAVASYSPTIYYRKTRHLLEDAGLRFDELVVFIDISDIQDEALYYELDAKGNVVDRPQSPVHQAPTLDRIEQVPARPLRAVLKQNSIILRVADRLKDRLFPKPENADAPALVEGFMAGDPRGSWTVDDTAYEEFGRDGLEAARASMDALLALVREHDIGLSVVVYPWPDQILARDDGERHAAFWSAWCAENELPFVDLFPLFLNGEDPVATLRQYYIPGDIHWNEAGHARVATAFLDQFPTGVPVLGQDEASPAR